MRLIDADALKGCACTVMEVGVADTYAPRSTFSAVPVRFIDEQPTVEAPQWISVTERLPEPDDLVLAYCPVRKETPSEVVMRGWAAMIHATHWMPLPSAPEVNDHV